MCFNSSPYHVPLLQPVIKQKRFLIRLSQDKDKYDETIMKFDTLKALNEQDIERVCNIRNGDELLRKVTMTLKKLSSSFVNNSIFL